MVAYVVRNRKTGEVRRDVFINPLLAGRFRLQQENCWDWDIVEVMAPPA